MLWQAQLEEQGRKMVVSEDDVKKLYEQKKDDYTQAKLRLIYIPFVTTPPAGTEAKKPLTEPEALAKADSVVKQAKGGTDFLQLVKEHSEDPISKEKGGEFGPVKRGDKLPDPIKQAVFQLKPGQISDPVRQPNGYYIFRLEALVPQSFDELKDSLSLELKNQRMREWMETNMKEVELKVEKPEFFAPAK